MRIWIARDASTPIYEQLSAQLLLGMLSGKLAPGERLPSVRALARRLHIHPNTVSAVYHDLAGRGWVESRRGSGVYVGGAGKAPGEGVDEFVSAWLTEARARGYSLDDLHSALARIEDRPRPRSVIVLDPDAELARILAAEISEAAGCPVASAGIGEATRVLTPRSYIVVHAGRAAQAAPLLGRLPSLIIRLNAMEEVLAGNQRPTSPALIGVVTRSPSVASWASTLLSALGFAADSVLLRDPAQTGWKQGLSSCGIVGADVVAAAELPAGVRPVIIRLVSHVSLEEMRGVVTAWKASQDGSS